MNDIRFVWAGKTYVVNYKAYDDDLTIVLPNGTALGKIKWLEVMPPTMEEVEEIPHVFQNMTAGQVVEHLGNAILARDYE